MLKCKLQYQLNKTLLLLLLLLLRNSEALKKKSLRTRLLNFKVVYFSSKTFVSAV